MIAMQVLPENEPNPKTRLINCFENSVLTDLFRRKPRVKTIPTRGPTVLLRILPIKRMKQRQKMIKRFSQHLPTRRWRLSSTMFHPISCNTAVVWKRTENLSSSIRIRTKFVTYQILGFGHNLQFSGATLQRQPNGNN